VVVDRAELIKWWDALDAAALPDNFEGWLELVRQCRHPDALWWASLFPAGEAVTLEHLEAVMDAHKDDARALFVSWRLKKDEGNMRRAAEMGYASAQAALACSTVAADEKVMWSRRAAAQGDRRASARWVTAFCLGKALITTRRRRRTYFALRRNWGVRKRSCTMARKLIATLTGNATCGGGVRLHQDTATGFVVQSTALCQILKSADTLESCTLRLL
jgi:hypothetical protein